MQIWVHNIIESVQNITSGMSKIISYIMILITLFVSIEVIGRYVFNHPTSWVWPVNRQLFGIYILMALAFTQSGNGHIRIEIFYDRFPPGLKTVAKWFAFVVMITFVGVLVWQTSIMAMNSIAANETASGAFKIPLYPFKTLIPIGSLILGIEVIISFITTGKDKSENTKAE